MNSPHPGPLASAAASPPHLGVGTDDLSTDAAIQEAVTAMLADWPLATTAQVDVTARGGVVTLAGTVSDGLWLARFKNQVTSAMPNVVIEDRLEWVLPDCSIGVA